jgi:hypothetical protein
MSCHSGDEALDLLLVLGTAGLRENRRFDCFSFQGKRFPAPDVGTSGLSDLSPRESKSVFLPNPMTTKRAGCAETVVLIELGIFLSSGVANSEKHSKSLLNRRKMRRFLPYPATEHPFCKPIVKLIPVIDSVIVGGILDSSKMHTHRRINNELAVRKAISVFRRPTASVGICASPHFSSLSHGGAPCP